MVPNMLEITYICKGQLCITHFVRYNQNCFGRPNNAKNSKKQDRRYSDPKGDPKARNG